MLYKLKSVKRKKRILKKKKKTITTILKNYKKFKMKIKIYYLQIKMEK